MEIAIVCQKFGCHYGGLEKYAVDLCRDLVDAGYRVNVFAHRWTSEPGIIFHRVPMIRLTSPMKNLSFAYFANQKLHGNRYDIIHSMERILYQDIFRVSDGINPVQIQTNYPNKPIRRIKAMGPRRLALQHLENGIFLKNGCRIVMTNSKLVRAQILTHYPILPERVSVIYNSIDTIKFHPGLKEKYRKPIRYRHGIDYDDLVLLFVSNNFKLKGLDLVLSALKELKSERFKLMVLGKDSTKPYREKILNYGLDRRVFFLGPVAQIDQYYGAGDILVLPTRYDAFANVCLEAMASGLPVITTPTNGASELIHHDRNGFVLENFNDMELAEIIRYLSESSIQNTMGKHARDTAARFTPAKHLSQVLALYERLALQKAARI